jgi:ligand-binding sensor domain-containing protein
MSCDLIEAREYLLQAVCQDLHHEWVQTRMQYRNCTGDISNEDGKLTCRRDMKRTVVPILGQLDVGIQGSNDGLYRGAPLGQATWTFTDGAPETIVMAQTSDGFLWRGGDSGLFCFDGRQFEPFHSPFGDQLLSTRISALYAPPSGGLWIGYQFGGISFLDKGRLRHYTGSFAGSNGPILFIVQDRGEILWAGTETGLWRLERSGWKHIDAEWNVPQRIVTNLELSPDGALWVSVDR